MAQTLPRRPTRNGRAERTPAPGLAPPARRARRWSVALVGILVTLGSALAFAVLWMNAGDRRPVLAVANLVPAGQVVEDSDLTVVRVSADAALRPVAASRRDEVVGKAAAVDLVPGSLLTESQLAEESLLESGSAVVGVALRGSQLPTPALGPGDRVLIVRTPAPGQAATAEGDESLGSVIDEGRVFDIGDRDVTNGQVVVSLIVDEESAAEVAGAASAGQVSLVLVPAA